MEAVLRVRQIASQGTWTWTGIYYLTFFIAITMPPVAVGIAFIGQLLGTLDTTTVIILLATTHLGEAVDVSFIAWLNPRAVAARYDKAFTFFAWLARIWEVLDPDDPATKKQIRYFLYRGVQLTQSTEALALYEGLYGTGAPEIPAEQALVDKGGTAHVPPE